MHFALANLVAFTGSSGGEAPLGQARGGLFQSSFPPLHNDAPPTTLLGCLEDSITHYAKLVAITALKNIVVALAGLTQWKEC